MPCTWITLPVRFVLSGIVTVFVVPCSVSLPVAGYVLTAPSFGTGARSIGFVSSNVAVGNCDGVHDPALELVVALALVARRPTSCRR